MTFRWTYYPWTAVGETLAVPLKADDLLHTTRTPIKHPATVPGYVACADVSYLSTRILLLASTAVHFEALYTAAQTVEKYLKAIWLDRNGIQPGTGHKLAPLAKKIAAAAYPDLQEFADPEFVTLCERLEPFEVAGRYPDNVLAGWQYPVVLLGFLDTFVVHCREVLGQVKAPNLIRELLTQVPDCNPVMQAAITAIRDGNRVVDQLLAWPDALAPSQPPTP